MITILALAAAIAAPPTPLVPLLERVRITVPDAREIRDLQVCPAQDVSPDGRASTVLIALARPRVAREYYRATMLDGRAVVLLPFWTTPGGVVTPGDARLLIAGLERKFEQCRWVPAAELAAGWAELDR